MSLLCLRSAVFPRQRNFRSFLYSTTMAQMLEANRLANEKSPYLLQHANNPVDWYPWGNEAFEKARSEGKLIFLSIGYSTCHWCHVMERESFENKSVAEIMNKFYVNVKVDREERPDVDKVYMTFVQATQGGGGWPLSVWLTPDLHPVYGGTYFPPEDRYFGRPGFKSILQLIAKQWNENPEKIKESGSKVIELLKKHTAMKGVPSENYKKDIPGVEALMMCFEQFCRTYEEQYGGFGDAPKFPQPTNLEFLMGFALFNRETEMAKRALEMVTHTLRMMAKGGIHDHVSKGFARYSTDKEWHVPHFEKMLYDQSQLASTYLTAFIVTGESLFEDMVHDILGYVLRDMTHSSGGFFSAEDADSYPTESSREKKEGAFCVWTYDEIKRHLGKETLEDGTALDEVFAYHYDVKKSGNVDPQKDPHDELKHQNVLIIRGSLEQTAAKFGLSDDTVREGLKKGLDILYRVRQQRPRPHLDDKMVTSWNGLMISAFARAAQVLERSQEVYEKAAVRAAMFVKEHLYSELDNTLLRSGYRDGERVVHVGHPVPGFLDDYAFLIHGLLDVYELTFDSSWLAWAEKLQDKQNELFWDGERCCFYETSDHDASILLRIADAQDGAEPSGNSMSVRSLLRLTQFLHRDDFKQQAEKLLACFGQRLAKVPMALPAMSTGLLLYRHSFQEVCIVGQKQDQLTQEFLKLLRGEAYMPNRTIVLVDGDTEGNMLYQRNPVLPSMKVPGRVFVCQDFVCQKPVASVEELRSCLQQTMPPPLSSSTSTSS